MSSIPMGLTCVMPERASCCSMRRQVRILDVDWLLILMTSIVALSIGRWKRKPFAISRGRSSLNRIRLSISAFIGMVTYRMSCWPIAECVLTSRHSSRSGMGKRLSPCFSAMASNCMRWGILYRTTGQKPLLACRQTCLGTGVKN